MCNNESLIQIEDLDDQRTILNPLNLSVNTIRLTKHTVLLFVSTSYSVLKSNIYFKLTDFIFQQHNS